jgi:uncharacterized protein (DUF2252 family)
MDLALKCAFMLRKTNVKWTLARVPASWKADQMVSAPVQPEGRTAALLRHQRLKMARSSHAYVRGNTARFYEWLRERKAGDLPEGPAIWICGDCHVGNLGPLANAEGRVEIQIRDLDQTVIGNPAHDLIRLGLSLASAARGSDLPGVTTARIIEQIIEGYVCAMESTAPGNQDSLAIPEVLLPAMRLAKSRSWRHLAREQIANMKPTIPLGRRFWPLDQPERTEIGNLFQTEHLRRLVTILRSRDDDAKVELLDAAYWRKGCSSLGSLRFCVLLGVGEKKRQLCLMDIKEALTAAAPQYGDVEMPNDEAQRVVEGCRHLSPHLGDRMRAAHFMTRPVVVRELLPQDLKVELTFMTPEDATSVAGFLANVVGRAHARQMDESTRKNWVAELRSRSIGALDAPAWLWSAVADLLAIHERAYLEHCRRFALEADA